MRRKNSLNLKNNQDRIVRHIEKWGSVTKAAKHIGVTRTAIYFALKRMPEFKERVTRAQDEYKNNLESTYHTDNSQ